MIYRIVSKNELELPTKITADTQFILAISHKTGEIYHLHETKDHNGYEFVSIKLSNAIICTSHTKCGAIENGLRNELDILEFETLKEMGEYIAKN